MFSQSHRDCPKATNQVSRTACVNQPRAVVATASKKSEAHHMLSYIYNWFTEGFDTKDLQEAKALIEELSH
jgi:predicted ATPase